MSRSSAVPTYDFYKKLHSETHFEYSRLEKAYNTYDASAAHRHDYYEIILFDQSGGHHEIDFVTFPIKKDTIHFILPGQVHLLKRASNVTGHVLAFKEEIFISNAFSISDEFDMIKNYFGSVLSLNKSEKEKSEAIILNLSKENQTSHAFKKQAVAAYLLLLLIEIMKLKQRFPETKKRTTAQIIYENYIKLIEKEFIRLHSVSEYASLLNITAGHLNDSVKKASGKNAGELIHERLALEAKRLLFHSDYTIKQIGSILNFDDPSYFARFFKSFAGETPQEFKKRIRNKNKE